MRGFTYTHEYVCLFTGRVVLGSGNNVDILVEGTGVEASHCLIDNKCDSVTLIPISESITIDGQHVASPTQLSQGCMICIGRSNYFRFNHPVEARLIKSFFPNTRISNFYDSGYENKKPPRKSWTDDDNISPKVFTSNSITVNSPAAAVLGSSRVNGITSPDGSVTYIEPPVPQTITSYPQRVCVTYNEPEKLNVQNGFGNPLFANYSYENVPPRTLSLPSPAFNRNPSPFVKESRRNTSPVSAVPRHQNEQHRHLVHNGNVEEMKARKNELEMKRNLVSAW